MPKNMIPQDRNDTIIQVPLEAFPGVIVPHIPVIALHVALQHPALIRVAVVDVIPVQELIQAIHGNSRSFAFLAGHIVMDEAVRHLWINDIIVHAALDDTVADVRR